jgi:methionine aminopeptidase
VEQVARKVGFTVVPCFTGHGIGSYFHGPPDIYHCCKCQRRRQNKRSLVCGFPFSLFKQKLVLNITVKSYYVITRSSYAYGTMISLTNTLKARLNCAGIASTSDVHTFVSVVLSAKDGMCCNNGNNNAKQSQPTVEQG